MASNVQRRNMASSYRHETAIAEMFGGIRLGKLGKVDVTAVTLAGIPLDIECKSSRRMPQYLVKLAAMARSESGQRRIVTATQGQPSKLELLWMRVGDVKDKLQPAMVDGQGVELLDERLNYGVPSYMLAHYEQASRHARNDSIPVFVMHKPRHSYLDDMMAFRLPDFFERILPKADRRTVDAWAVDAPRL